MTPPTRLGKARRLGIRPPDLGVYGVDWAYGRGRVVVLFPRLGVPAPAGWARLRRARGDTPR